MKKLRIIDRIFMSSELKSIVKYVMDNDSIDLTIYIDKIPNLWNKIKEYINPNITYLKVPFKTIKDDLEYLKNFKKLDTLDLSKDFILDYSNAIDISRQLDVNDVIVSDLEEELMLCDNIYGDNTLIGIIEGKTLFHLNSIKPRKLKFNFAFNTINTYLINKINTYLNINDLESLDIIDLKSISSYYWEIKDKSIISCDVVTYSNKYLNQKNEEFNKRNSDKGNHKIVYSEERDYDIISLVDTFDLKLSDDVEFSIQTDDFVEVENLYKYINQYKIKKFTIKIKDLNILSKKLNIDYDGLLNVEVKIDDMNDILKLYNKISSSVYNVSGMICDVNNADYYSEKYDYSVLEDLSKNINLEFKYSYYSASILDFISMVESIRWYRKIIADYNLSPIERLMFAYDLVKTFPYSHDNYAGDNFRAPHLIIKNGQIVCAGYCNLLSEILKDDDDINIIKDGIKEIMHARCLIKIDDDKYNIHGIYVSDITQDSVISDLKNYPSKDYNGMDLYNFFLITINEYKDVFNNEPHLKVINDYLKYGIFNCKAKQELFGYYTSDDTIKRYLFYSKKLDKNTLKQILVNVRIAEGYSEKEIEKEVKKVIYENLKDSLNNYSKLSYYVDTFGLDKYKVKKKV